MGTVTGLLGMGGGAAGTGVQITNPVSGQELAGANSGVQNSLNSQNDLLNALTAQNGIQNQSNVYNQLQDIAAGQGPNPAQAMLNQATGQNVANQASLMAGQRGAAANPALIARQAAQQGAGIQQNAIGQGATMQANQSLNALTTAGQLANQMASNRMSQNQALTNAELQRQGTLNNAYGNYNQIQSGLAQNVQKQQSQVLGGIMNGASAGMGMLGGTPQAPAASGQNSILAGEASPMNGAIYSAKGGQIPNQPMSIVGQHLAGMYGGGNVGGSLQSGGHVPGNAKVSGDSYKNDTVKAMLSPGEIVLPRSVVNSKDPVRSSAEFVRGVLAKKGRA